MLLIDASLFARVQARGSRAGWPRSVAHASPSKATVNRLSQ
jgi:hypothetical protein